VQDTLVDLAVSYDDDWSTVDKLAKPRTSLLDGGNEHVVRGNGEHSCNCVDHRPVVSHDRLDRQAAKNEYDNEFEWA